MHPMWPAKFKGRASRFGLLNLAKYEDFTLPPLFRRNPVESDGVRRSPTDSYGTFFRTGLSKI